MFGGAKQCYLLPLQRTQVCTCTFSLWYNVNHNSQRLTCSTTPAPSHPPTITCYSSCNHRKEVGPNLFGGLAAGRGRGCIFCSFRSCISFPWFLMLCRNDSQVPVWKPFWNKMKRPFTTILLASQETRNLYDEWQQCIEKPHSQASVVFITRGTKFRKWD